MVNRMVTVEFHFDFGSPNAYLSHLVIPEIEKRTSVKFEYVPVLLGGVFKLTNNRSPAEALRGVRNKPEYERLETQRFIRRHGITRFQNNPYFPVNTLMIMRGAIAARRLSNGRDRLNREASVATQARITSRMQISKSLKFGSLPNGVNGMQRILSTRVSRLRPN